MAVKDITDVQVCQAYIDARAADLRRWPCEFLVERTGQPEKVCYRAMERAARRDLIDYGVSLSTGWLTDKGKELINKVQEK